MYNVEINDMFNYLQSAQSHGDNTVHNLHYRQREDEDLELLNPFWGHQWHLILQFFILFMLDHLHKKEKPRTVAFTCIIFQWRSCLRIRFRVPVIYRYELISPILYVWVYSNNWWAADMTMFVDKCFFINLQTKKLLYVMTMNIAMKIDSEHISATRNESYCATSFLRTIVLQQKKMRLEKMNIQILSTIS